MTKEEIIQQEQADIQDQRNILNRDINTLKEKRKTASNKEALELRKKILQKERQLAKLPKTPQQHTAKKIERMRMNRVLSQLKF